MSVLEDKIKVNQERLDALRADNIGIDLTPPRLQHLESWLISDDEREAYELAWQTKVDDILDEIEPQVARAKLTMNKPMAGQLSLV